MTAHAHTVRTVARPRRPVAAIALASAAFATSMLGCESASSGPTVTLTDAERAEGWVLLFDGRYPDTFRGYRSAGLPPGWGVDDGALHRRPGPAAGDIVTRVQYGDFEFVCEWRIAKGGNSGVIYRCDEAHGAPWETGPEMQVLDDAANPETSPLHRAGAMYDLFPPAADVVKPQGEWNEVRIVARGAHIEHWLNGVKVVDADLASDAYRAALAASKWTGYKDFNSLARGHIALQDHGDEVWYRNIRVRRFD